MESFLYCLGSSCCNKKSLVFQQKTWQQQLLLLLIWRCRSFLCLNRKEMHSCLFTQRETRGATTTRKNKKQHKVLLCLLWKNRLLFVTTTKPCELGSKYDILSQIMRSSLKDFLVKSAFPIGKPQLEKNMVELCGTIQ